MQSNPSFTDKLNTEAPRASVPWLGSTRVRAGTIKAHLHTNYCVDGQGWSLFVFL